MHEGVPVWPPLECWCFSQVLELCYEGHGVCMVIFLPTEIEGLADMEAKLTAATVSPQ